MTDLEPTPDQQPAERLDQQPAERPDQQPAERPDPVSLELARALKAAGISQGELARRMGISRPVISRLLSPRYHGHSMPTLREIAAALDMEVEVKFKKRG